MYRYRKRLADCGKLSVSEMLPPDHKVTSGRPKKKRWASTSNKKRTCMKSGLEGHMGSTCEKPDTEFRYYQNREKAIKWAEGIVANGILGVVDC